MIDVCESILRPDVAVVVSRRAIIAGRLGADFCWDAYTDAKTALSRCCGDDAPPDRRDQEQYDLAIRAYLERVGL